MRIILQTPRLVLREIESTDVDALAAVYADPETMRFFTGARSRERAAADISWARDQYARAGFAFYATVLRETGVFVGRCGLLPQVLNETRELEVAYMLDRRYWGQGLATEAARALRDYAFRTTTQTRVISIIAPGNARSIRVAERNGMRFVRDIWFDGARDRLYEITRAEWSAGPPPRAAQAAARP